MLRAIPRSTSSTRAFGSLALTRCLDEALDLPLSGGELSARRASWSGTTRRPRHPAPPGWVQAPICAV
eukprot:5460260-Pyramimonas_sp.AAC.1